MYLNLSSNGPGDQIGVNLSETDPLISFLYRLKECHAILFGSQSLVSKGQGFEGMSL